MEHTGFFPDPDAGIHHNEKTKGEVYWSQHWIIKYDNSYYDSSYGKAYGSGDTGKTAIIHSLIFGYIPKGTSNFAIRNGADYDPNGPEKDKWMTFDEIYPSAD